MTMMSIVESIDNEINRLTSARELLDGMGRKSMKAAPNQPTTKKRHVMSAEARRRIGEAQRKRWAAQNKAS